MNFKSKIVLHQGALKIDFYHRGRLQLTTGIRVDPKYWNSKKQIILAYDDIDVDTLNKEIHLKRRWVDNLIWEDYQQNGDVSIQRIKEKTRINKNATNAKFLNVENRLIGDLFQRFINIHKSYWSPILQRRYENLHKMVNEENILIDDLDKMFLRRLIDRIKLGELGNGINTNTLKFRFKKFKSFFNWCIEKGYTKKNEHLNALYKEIKDFEPDFITLTEERIQQLFSYRSPFITYNRVRDTALVLIFTGMRYSDFESLQPSDIVNGYIDKISKKTKIRFKVPIHPDISKLLLTFPEPLPQQKFNNYFKKVGRDLGWNEQVRMRVDFDRWETAPFQSLLSSHIGRHTAATRWLLQSIPTHVIKIWGGWKKEEMINHYGAKIKLSTDSYMTKITGREITMETQEI